MKYYVLLDNSDPSKYAIIGSRGFDPESYIAIAPKDTNGEYIKDPAIIRIDDIQPMVDQPKQAVDADGLFLFETLQRETYDMQGQPILDANENPVLEDYQSEVIELDVNGDPVMESVPFGDTYKQAFIDADLSIVRDSELLQEGRNGKLGRLRQKRNLLLEEVDLMANDLILGDRVDTAAVQLYRQQLKDITSTYKDVDPLVALPALDSLKDDLSDLLWPVKP